MPQPFTKFFAVLTIVQGVLLVAGSALLSYVGPWSQLTFETILISNLPCLFFLLLGEAWFLWVMLGDLQTQNRQDYHHIHHAKDDIQPP